MRLHVIPSPFYAANGLVLVPSGAGTALVVDPSAGIQHLIRDVLELEGDVRVGFVGRVLEHGAIGAEVAFQEIAAVPDGQRAGGVYVQTAEDAHGARQA